MDIYKDQIGRIVHEQKELLNIYTNELSRMSDPDDERLIRCRNNGKDMYYRAHRENGKYKRKSLGSDQSAINTLARKEYLRVAIEVLNNNIDVLETSCKRLGNLDFDSIKSGMYKACRELPDEAFFVDGEGKGSIIAGHNNE